MPTLPTLCITGILEFLNCENLELQSVAQKDVRRLRRNDLKVLDVGGDGTDRETPPGPVESDTCGTYRLTRNLCSVTQQHPQEFYGFPQQ